MSARARTLKPVRLPAVFAEVLRKAISLVDVAPRLTVRRLGLDRLANPFRVGVTALLAWLRRPASRADLRDR